MKTQLVSDSYVVGKTDVLTFRDTTGFILEPSLNADPTRLINLGRIEVTDRNGSTDVYGVQVQAQGFPDGGSFWNRAGASLTVSATGQALATGVAAGVLPLVRNDGDISVSAENVAVAISTYGQTGASKIVNTGHILAQADHAGGINMALGGVLHNTGEIRVIGFDSVGVHLHLGGAIDNHGGIVVSGPSGAYSGVALSLDGADNGAIKIFNSGEIAGQYALWLPFSSGSAVSLANTGDMRGDILLAFGADHIVNSGTMTGEIQLGPGENVYDGRGGSVVGGVYGGSDADLMMAGASAVTFYGGGGGDTLIGGRGDDILSGGQGVIDGGKGGDLLYGGDNETFVYHKLSDSRVDASDLIFGLTNEDVIDLSAIDADRTQAGNQDFVLWPNFDGRAGIAVLTYDASIHATRLELDTDGDAQADMAVLIDGDHTDFRNFVL